MIKKYLQNAAAQKQAERKAELRRKLLRHEAKIGGQLFGPVPDGSRREFFCLDRHTWIWFEQWLDSNGHQQVVTTRYNVRPDRILKAQNGAAYQPVSPLEAATLYEAANAYTKRIKTELYSFV